MPGLSETAGILGTLFSELENPEYGWTTTLVNEAFTDIEQSTLLVSQLTEMQALDWTYQLEDVPDSFTETHVTGEPGETVIADSVASGTFPVMGSQVNDLLTTMAYEAGHAEDPQYNSIDYLDNTNSDLQFGAEVAYDLLGEGKSLYNLEVISTQITSLAVFIPYDPGKTVLTDGPTTQAILAGASAAGLGVLPGLPKLLTNYWAFSAAILEKEPGPSARMPPSPF